VHGAHPIDGVLAFLEDKQSNLWPVLNRNLAYDRAMKYAVTKSKSVMGYIQAFSERSRVRQLARPTSSLAVTT